MNEEVKFYLDDAKDSMQKAVKHTENELTKIRAGKVAPNMLEGITVEYYGTATPLSQVASVNSVDARTLSVKPWEKNMMSHIEKAIRDSDLNVNPTNNGETVLIPFPPLTEERRKLLVKNSKNEGENGKVRVRNIRKDTNEELKKLQKDGVAEDEVKKAEELVQTMTNDFIAKIDQLLAAKEAEIMTV